MMFLFMKIKKNTVSSSQPSLSDNLARMLITTSFTDYTRLYPFGKGKTLYETQYFSRD